MSTLLESADRNEHGAGLPAPSPPPAPDSGTHFRDVPSLERRDRDVMEDIVRAQHRLDMRTEAARARSRQTRGNEPAQTDPLRRLRISPGSAVRSRPSRHREDGPARGSARTTLPTPPLDQYDPEADLFAHEIRRSSHPLTNEWNAHSLADGLGDRNRSPTPADGWEVMRSTINPDPTLPSADSSFTSAAASQSFNSQPGTNVTEPDQNSRPTSSSDGDHGASNEDSESDSASSVDQDDLVCEDEESAQRQMVSAANFAEDMYDLELSSSRGRVRVQEQERIRALNGNRFALSHEHARIDIGFRLIEEALETDEGRERLLQIGAFDGEDDFQSFMRDRVARMRQRQQDTLDLYDSDSLTRRETPQYSDATWQAVSEARAQVHNYFRRYTADALVSPANRTHSPRHARDSSLPPRYFPVVDGPLASHPDVDAFVSRDAPEPHPVSPPTQRSQTEVADALLSGSETEDMGAMRRVVERLARRDDVPESWWMSMGLNLSRTRPQRARSPRPAQQLAVANRVQAGRVERRNSRL